MNKKQEQDNRLLAETFHDDWANGRAADFARAAASTARRRRTTRQALGAVATALLIIATAWVFGPRPVAPSAPVAFSPQPTAAPSYEIISDDELLAHLRDQSLLVVKQPDGSREITLLPSAEEAAAETLE